ncbi:PIN domain-containing protein [Desulfuribacillus alkaliarsenatis]|uniref:PIN domain-containing protein n=1 Tax=Desulfuribacillus alkaliarsenatis TaxID=766136 RepID=A0A1E5G1L8_9FIRM|nr:PIN domain-containing protein [Desulfuribacillus alkaliarsenatis]OEF96804.1 hypothetical protein BHF68_06995 [Desulfuribacillus alkaliarsenatis]
MKILFDTNIILDVLQKRDPFYIHSSAVLRMVETKQVKGFITANSVTDIYYILNRTIKDKKAVYSALIILLQVVDIIDVTSADVKSALRHDVIDFEDELISVCASRAKINYIISRNTEDFVDSLVNTITPEQFLELSFKN